MCEAWSIVPLRVHGLRADLADLAAAAAKGQRPFLSAARFQVGGDDRREGEVPALVEVVVYERLERKHGGVKWPVDQAHHHYSL